MGPEGAPLRLEIGRPHEGLRVVRQPPPAGAASFSATYFAPAGWGFDPAGVEGTARLLNQVMASATQRLDRVQLARRLDRSGATLSHAISPEAAEFTIWGPADEWRPLLGLLAEVVRLPRYDPEDIARVRRQLLERQLRELTQPASRANSELLKLVYPPAHPYRSTGLGTRRSVERLDRARLERFHREHYTADGAAVVVTSAASLSSVERSIRGVFSFPSKSKPAHLRFPRLRARSPERRVLDLPGQSQVEIRLGGPSIPQDAPAYTAAYLGNEVLGGRPLQSRLFQRIRARNGLAYHASSDLDTMRWGGIWTAQAGTGPDRWRRVVPMLEAEVGRLRRELVPQRELSATRRSTVGAMQLALESTAEAHGLAVDVAYHELPADYLLRWPARLRSVRPVDVRAAARLAFDQNHSATIVAGPVGPV